MRRVMTVLAAREGRDSAFGSTFTIAYLKRKEELM